MRRPNFFISYRMFRKGKISGQIAVLVILLVAIAFLFMAVLFNLSKISEHKALVTLAADSAVLNLASALASYSFYMSQTYLKGGTKLCESHLLPIIVGAIIFIIAMIVAPYFVGHIFILINPVVPTAASTIITWIGIGGLITSLSYTAQLIFITPMQIAMLNKELSKLSLDQQLMESAIKTALLQSVTDKEKIKDDGSESFDGRVDIDMDGRTDDYVSRFADWYRKRLMGFEDNSFLPSIRDFLCLSYGLADTSSYINYYAPTSEERQCAVINSYNPSMLSFTAPVTSLDPRFIGYDGRAIDDGLYATGMYMLFYDIEAAGNDKDGNPYTLSFWDKGVTFDTPTCSTTSTPPCSCPVLSLATNPNNPNLPFPGNDDFDYFKQDLTNFFGWAYGQDVPIAVSDNTGNSYNCEWHKGIVNTGVSTLRQEFNNWFTSLYNSADRFDPLDPIKALSTWYAKSERWVYRMHNWAEVPAEGNLVDIKNRMIAERDALQAILNQIGNNQTLINQLQAALDALAPLYAWQSQLQSDMAVLQIRINDCAANPACAVQVLEMLQKMYDKLQAELNEINAEIDRQQQQLANLLGVPYVPGTDYRPDANARIAQLTNDIAGLSAQFNNLGGAARINQLNDLINRIDATINKLLDFKLRIEDFQVRVADLAAAASSQMPPLRNCATYSWEDKNNYWHHVRVQVYQLNPFPTIRAWAEGFMGSTTCQGFVDGTESGSVAVKVIRFDEDQNVGQVAGKKEPMKFASGTPLWRFIFYDPRKGKPYSGNVHTYTPSDDLFRYGVSYSACATYNYNGIPQLVTCQPGMIGTCNQ